MNNTVHIAYNILADNAAIATRDLERCTRQRLAGLCINLFYEQTGFLRVLEGKRVSLALFQRYRVRGLVDDVSRRGPLPPLRYNLRHPVPHRRQYRLRRS